MYFHLGLFDVEIIRSQGSGVEELLLVRDSNYLVLERFSLLQVVPMGRLRRMQLRVREAHRVCE